MKWILPIRETYALLTGDALSNNYGWNYFLQLFYVLSFVKILICKNRLTKVLLKKNYINIMKKNKEHHLNLLNKSKNT